MFVFVCFDIHSNKRQVFALTKCLFYVLLLFFPATCLCFYFFLITVFVCVCVSVRFDSIVKELELL